MSQSIADPHAPAANVTNKVARLCGFDYLRVFFMVSVIVGHANLVKGWAEDRAARVGPGPNLWDYFYFHLQSCAVPAFVLVSMILFLLKTPTWERTRARLTNLGYLYGFWVGAWVLYTKSKPEHPGIPGIIEFLLRGGNWVFYFIAVLIICTWLGWVAGNLSRRGRWVGLGLATAALGGTYGWLLQNDRWVHSHYYWVPTCFTMMPFVAALMVPHLETLRGSPSVRWKWIGIFVGLAILAALWEWRHALPAEVLDEERRWIPKHARFSIQFGALAMVLLAIGVKAKPGRVISFLSRNALGTYCLHPFVLGGFVKGTAAVLGKYLPQWQSASIVLGCAVLIVCCSFATEFLRRAFRHRLV